MPLKREATKSTIPNPQATDSEEEQNPPPADPQSASDLNPIDPKIEINHAQIVGQIMTDIEATNEEEIGGQGTDEPTQEHPAPLIYITSGMAQLRGLKSYLDRSVYIVKRKIPCKNYYEVVTGNFDRD